MTEKQAYLRRLPAVDQLLKEPELGDLLKDLPRRVVMEAVQETIEVCRQRIMNCPSAADMEKIPLDRGCLSREAAVLAHKKNSYSLYAVVNATGTVLHTNLGRAPLSLEATERVAAIAGAYNNLEMDMEAGARGSRMAHLEKLICELTGAEAALVVNNNAAALFLILHTLAQAMEVIVSRGQLVEIGGSFRIPAIMRASGAWLVEVGATNKCYRRDYEEALSDQTALILKVHTSNYRIMGFTAETERHELVELGRLTGVPLVEDLGSGAMVDLNGYGIFSEPLVKKCLAEGVSLVTFSGDKLLGGPQAGIIAGNRELVAQCRRNPVMRALRIDKMAVAALEATLRVYREPEVALREIPALRMLNAGSDELKNRARALLRRLRKLPAGIEFALWKGVSAVGGGALPLVELPGWGVSAVLDKVPLAEAAYCLRTGNPPVVVRVQQDRIILDVRTILPGDEIKLEQAFKNLLKQQRGEIN